MRNTSSKIRTMVAGATIVCSLLVPGAFAQSGSDDGPCSNRTIKGDYGFRVEGTLMNGPRKGLLRAVAMTHFDGQGNLTQVDFGLADGVPFGADWRPATGTYTVNGDCTGSAVINPQDGSPAINLRLVVVKSGKEIHTVVIGNPTGSVGYKID